MLARHPSCLCIVVTIYADENYLLHVYQMLNISSRAEAALDAKRLHLI
jgi:hypothetical protein